MDKSDSASSVRARSRCVRRICAAGVRLSVVLKRCSNNRRETPACAAISLTRMRFVAFARIKLNAFTSATSEMANVSVDCRVTTRKGDTRIGRAGGLPPRISRWSSAAASCPMRSEAACTAEIGTRDASQRKSSDPLNNATSSGTRRPTAWQA